MEAKQIGFAAEESNIEGQENERTKEMLDEATIRGRRSYRICSRIRDVLFSLIALAILWPFMLLIALLIVIDSPGASPIFSQKRVGLNGKEFVFYKFRTMKPNAEEELEELLPDNEMQGPVFKIRNDPRLTRMGRLLRKPCLDELPQLINIIRGDMSIVGPRPALPREVEQYDAYERQRLTVLPGLSGYWQIQPNRNSVSFDDWIEWDLKYIRERSLWVDWHIIMKTIAVVLKMDGQ